MWRKLYILLTGVFPTQQLGRRNLRKKRIHYQISCTLTALLLLLLPGVPASNCTTSISVLVTNSVTSCTANQTYSTCVVFRGILLGGLRRLQESNEGFEFTYTEDPNYGPFLQSVNGLAGSTNERTYWELLVKNENNTIRPNVGIGCYIPSTNDEIILKYNMY
ncbi:transcobalamin-1-like [Cottoperca gobio]|uniref:Transcobalamin-1-like n=1 Tax=Cottoperca gobio TaxID=56716 RepID=A0A6J2QVV3_COTGO|nr:transcobalamin-1-like [Cottoperca gobio]